MLRVTKIRTVSSNFDILLQKPMKYSRVYPYELHHYEYRREDCALHALNNLLSTRTNKGWLDRSDMSTAYQRASLDSNGVKGNPEKGTMSLGEIYQLALIGNLELCRVRNPTGLHTSSFSLQEFGSAFPLFANADFVVYRWDEDYAMPAHYFVIRDNWLVCDSLNPSKEQWVRPLDKKFLRSFSNGPKTHYQVFKVHRRIKDEAKLKAGRVLRGKQQKARMRQLKKRKKEERGIVTAPTV